MITHDPQTGYEAQWWRAMGVFRLLSVVYAAALLLWARADYEHVAAAWLALGGLAVWSALKVVWYRKPTLRRWPLLSIDLLVAAVAIVATRLLQHPEAVERGAQTLPVMWVVAPVVAWSLVHGWLAGVASTGIVGIANFVERGAVTAASAHNTVLVALAGALVGYVATLARRAEAQLVQVSRAEAGRRERERLSRAVHDGVLQVLAYVTRRGTEIGGEAAELARLSADQEVALRNLMSSDASDQRGRPGGEVDVASELRSFTGPKVTVSTPVGPVDMPADRVEGLMAVVRAILDNVDKHAGDAAHAYVLLEGPVEQGDDAIVVTVRDNGVGCSGERLEQASAQGRMGVRHSIIGRARDLGGSVEFACREGDGVTVVVAIPRSDVSARAAAS
jgi:signal transduction histidine kinase